jgi:hypothetical protein
MTGYLSYDANAARIAELREPRRRLRLPSRSRNRTG